MSVTATLGAMCVAAEFRDVARSKKRTLNPAQTVAHGDASTLKHHLGRCSLSNARQGDARSSQLDNCLPRRNFRTMGRAHEGL